MTQVKAAATQSEWKRFDRAFKAEMVVPTARRTLDLLVVLSAPISRSLLVRKRAPLPPVIASRSSDGPWREPGIVAIATVEAVVSDSQDSVPRALRRPTYIPFVNVTPERRNIP